MNREIKFRGKRVDNGEWVYGLLLEFNHPNSKICIQQKDNIANRGWGCCTDDTINTSVDMYEVIPNTIGQYTGLKDKNGKEIYERDIVNYIYGDRVGNDVCVENEEVKLDDYYTLLTMKNSNELEVIGNTHDKEEKK